MSAGSANFKLAYRSLKAAKARSFLTMLGIVIGVMAVVLVVCIGQGVKEQIAGQFNRYGKKVLTVQPGSPNDKASVLAGLPGAASELLTEKDLAVVQKTEGIVHAAPIAITNGTASGDHTVTSPLIIATTADFSDIVNQSMASGGFFDPDINSQTIVLGQSIAHKLFDDNAPLGQGLTWRGERFVVAGVFNDFKAPPLSLEASFNDALFVPLSTAETLTSNSLGIYQILAKASSTDNVDTAITSVTNALVRAHGGAHDVTVERTAQSSTASSQTIHLLTLLVGGSAIIALIVGSIGIMDVMLVSVTERMHEIGIRKAVGATNRQIMNQFVSEAFVLSAIGAVLGLVFAGVCIGLLRLYSSLQPVLVWQVLVVAPVIAVGVGVFFGSMPALKAARKDPIEALRHE